MAVTIEIEEGNISSLISDLNYQRLNGKWFLKECKLVTNNYAREIPSCLPTKRHRKKKDLLMRMNMRILKLVLENI